MIGSIMYPIISPQSPHDIPMRLDLFPTGSCYGSRIDISSWTHCWKGYEVGGVSWYSWDLTSQKRWDFMGDGKIMFENERFFFVADCHKKTTSNSNNVDWTGCWRCDIKTGWWFGTWIFIFPYIGNVIIPTVTHSIIFQRGRAQPPTRRYSGIAEMMWRSRVAGFRIFWIFRSMNCQSRNHGDWYNFKCWFKQLGFGCGSKWKT